MLWAGAMWWLWPPRSRACDEFPVEASQSQGPHPLWAAIIGIDCVAGFGGDGTFTDVNIYNPMFEPFRINVLALDDWTFEGEKVVKPFLAWRGDHVLEVRIPNLTPINYRVREALGVELKIVFVPDDPSARRDRIANSRGEQHRDWYDLD